MYENLKSYSPSGLDESSSNILMFGGKGGVGKTTCASATALHYASLGKKTLILSSDLTPSLSDIFEQDVGAEERPVYKNLHALEITQEKITERWKEKFSQDFYEILSRIIDVEKMNKESEYELRDYIGSAPALKEETMLDYILELAKSKRYEKLIWDTAPTGETLTLLNMPKLIRGHLKAGAKVYESLDKLGKRMSFYQRNRDIRKTRGIAEIMDSWIKMSEEIASFIKDYKNTEFVVVTIPEKLGVDQTQILVETLDKYEINLTHMIINNVVEQADSDFLRKRAEMQKEYIQILNDRYKTKLKIVKLPMFPYVKGIEGLKAVEEKLFK